MKYNGGKHRIASEVAAAIHEYGASRTVFIEPFMGGANITARMGGTFPITIAGEYVLDLAMMWQAVKDGWRPPFEVSEAQYAAARHAEPSAERAFIGFACSFGAKWFGGYARGGPRRTNYAGEGLRSIDKKRPGVEATTAIVHADYRQFRALMGPAVIAYCDPPYAGTVKYNAAGSFDSAAFWDEMRTWREMGAMVLVSEYNAPLDWWPVREWTPQASLSRADKSKRAVEKLWMLP